MYSINISSKRYDDLEVVRDFKLGLEKNKVTCLFGPSGCGKTTLLNIIAGLDRDYEGACDTSDLDISYVFQEPRLIPWLSVYDNIEYVLRDKLEAGDIEGHILRYLEEVDLLEFRDALPNSLSGGMKQRVSLVRGFAHPHEILILDEPFIGIDHKMRAALIENIKRLMKIENKTVVLVTHDLEVAKTLADNIVRLEGKPLRIVE